MLSLQDKWGAESTFISLACHLFYAILYSINLVILNLIFINFQKHAIKLNCSLSYCNTTRVLYVILCASPLRLQCSATIF